jgi:hypothetical protein
MKRSPSYRTIALDYFKASDAQDGDCNWMLHLPGQQEPPAAEDIPTSQVTSQVSVPESSLEHWNTDPGVGRVCGALELSSELQQADEARGW